MYNKWHRRYVFIQVPLARATNVQAINSESGLLADCPLVHICAQLFCVMKLSVNPLPHNNTMDHCTGTATRPHCVFQLNNQFTVCLSWNIQHNIYATKLICSWINTHAPTLSFRSWLFVESPPTIQMFVFVGQSGLNINDLFGKPNKRYWNNGHRGSCSEPRPELKSSQ